MNFYPFINSCDIRNHLEEKNYQFSTLESAWLVKQSRNTTIDERHSAWNEIIQTMPDCEVRSLNPDAPVLKSIHDMLKKYMEIENDLLKQFYKDEANAAYVYQRCYEWSDGDLWSCKFFPSYQSCKENYQVDEDALFIKFGKTYINGKGKKIELITTPDLVPVCLTSNDFDDDECDIIYHDFWDVNPNFPTPFLEGDILTYAYGKYESKSSRETTFVLTERTTELMNTHGPSPILCDFDVDKLEYRYHGYRVDDALDISHVQYYWYMDLEIANERMDDYDSKERLLSTVSSYLKGKCDLPDVLDAQKYANS